MRTQGSLTAKVCPVVDDQKGGVTASPAELEGITAQQVLAKTVCGGDTLRSLIRAERPVCVHIFEPHEADPS